MVVETSPRSDIRKHSMAPVIGNGKLEKRKKLHNTEPITATQKDKRTLLTVN